MNLKTVSFITCLASLVIVTLALVSKVHTIVEPSKEAHELGWEPVLLFLFLIWSIAIMAFDAGRGSKE